MAKRYSELPNEVVGAANGVDYAYRDTGGGEGGVPLVLPEQFRGNLDNCAILQHNHPHCAPQQRSSTAWPGCSRSGDTVSAPNRSQKPVGARS
jgi:hypothetical protein